MLHKLIICTFTFRYDKNRVIKTSNKIIKRKKKNTIVETAVQ